MFEKVKLFVSLNKAALIEKGIVVAGALTGMAIVAIGIAVTKNPKLGEAVIEAGVDVVEAM